MEATRQIRRYRRLQGWDYRRGAVLFVTIVTEPRRAVFGCIRQGEMQYSPLGEIVAGALDDMTGLNPGIVVHGRKVMPDHVHFNVYIKPGLDEPLKVFGKAIGRFKNYTLKQAKLLGVVSAGAAGRSPAFSTVAWPTSGRSSATSTVAGQAAGHSPAFSTVAGPIGGRSSATSTVAGQAAGHSPAFSTVAGPIGGRYSATSTGLGRVDGRQAATASEDSRAMPGQLSPEQVAEQAATASGGGRAEPGRLWQQGCHDRLCLRREFIDATERYIAYNAMKWELMHGADAALRIHEPLDFPCLDPGDYWKGVGNTTLLEGKIVSLRISRQVRAPAAVATVVARMKRAVDKGYVILSGFISPGEKAVRDMLCATPSARFIRILPSCIPNARFRPESRYVPAFSEGRYLEIAKGNDEVAFGRAACLDYNAEIVSIAQASEGGMAIYYRPSTARPSPLLGGGGASGQASGRVRELAGGVLEEVIA